MALNIAVPLSGVGDFFEGFGLLSPISPISVDCRENLKLLVSPIGSESSGVSSLDSEESKEKKSPIKEELKVTYKGRNILDLHSNLNDNQWKFSPALLPENNFKMYLANRSQYHRLSNNSHIQDYSLLKCQCCDFRYPVENYKYNLSGAAAANHNVNNNNKNNYQANNNYININNNYVNNNNNSRNYQSFKKFYDEYNKTETNFNNNTNNNNNNSSITYCLYRQF
jgi:hypothetical protein